MGGAGHKVMLLMEGKAHAYVFPSPGENAHEQICIEYDFSITETANGEMSKC